MAKIKRENFVRQSEVRFLTFFFLSIVTLLGGIGYLIIFRDYVDIQQAGLKILGAFCVLSVLTVIFYRQYKGDESF